MNNRHDDISHSNKWTRVPSDLSSVEPILCVPDLHIPMPSNFSFAIIIIFIWKRALQLSNRMTPVESGTVVAIFAEGKTHALAVGVQCVCTVQHQNKIWLLTQLSWCKHAKRQLSWFTETCAFRLARQVCQQQRLQRKTKALALRITTTSMMASGTWNTSNSSCDSIPIANIFCECFFSSRCLPKLLPRGMPSIVKMCESN